jgi:hypothetical protein
MPVRWQPLDVLILLGGIKLGKSFLTWLTCGALAACFGLARTDLGSAEPSVFDVEFDRFLAVK